MARQKLLLLTGALVAAILLTSGTEPAAAGPHKCTVVELGNGTCVSGKINGGGVSLSGHKHSGGSNGGGSGSNRNLPQKHKCPLLDPTCVVFKVTPPAGPPTPPVSIDEVKNFDPTAGSDHMEPNGWMIVGLSTNFYSVGGVEVRNGTLLGQPASVRFTPILWHWIYGDGKLATRSTKGATWAAQKIPDFSQTPTSHIYAKPGTYFIDLSITFRAEYRYAGGSWIPVVGAITLPSNRLEATAGDAKTVLVNHDCRQNPGGPGC